MNRAARRRLEKWAKTPEGKAAIARAAEQARRKVELAEAAKAARR